MSKKINILNSTLTMIFTCVAFLFVLFLINKFYVLNTGELILFLSVGFIIATFFSALFHEFGHYFAGKRNGFAFSAMSVWFLRWNKEGGKTKFSFAPLGSEAGYTEMLPTTPDNVEKKFVSMTLGGIIASFITILIGIPPLFMGFLSACLFCIWSMFFVVGVYYFFGTILPVANNGVLNDGAVILNIKKNTIVSQVVVNLLKIQAHLYQGKTPAQIDKALYFDVPQLPEDDINFALLLNARYSYYLDDGDYENAKKVTERLLSLEDYLTKQHLMIFKTDALYNACTFDYNESLADDLLYEVEKYVNKVNSATNIRIKLAYLLGVGREKENLNQFFIKGYKEADRCQIRGLGLYERKLLDQLKLKNNE